MYTSSTPPPSTQGKMAAEKARATEDDLLDDEEEGEQFITEDDILAEVQDGGDHPMEEDDEEDEAGDTLGDLSASGSSSKLDDNSVQHFLTHGASVFVIACHPTEPLAASGGEDDLGYIWDITDGEVIVKLTGHTDSVTSIAWSSDGEMIATGGMDGKIRIWRRVGKDNYKIWEFLTELQGPDEVMVWFESTSIFFPHLTRSVVSSLASKRCRLIGRLKRLYLVALAMYASYIYIFNFTDFIGKLVPSGKTMQVFAGHTGAVNCGEFTPDGTYPLL
jgi:ribosome assembly protein SQT1